MSSILWPIIFWVATGFSFSGLAQTNCDQVANRAECRLQQAQQSAQASGQNFAEDEDIKGVEIALALMNALTSSMAFGSLGAPSTCPSSISYQIFIWTARLQSFFEIFWFRGFSAQSAARAEIFKQEMDTEAGDYAQTLAYEYLIDENNDTADYYEKKYQYHTLVGAVYVGAGVLAALELMGVICPPTHNGISAKINEPATPEEQRPEPPAEEDEPGPTEEQRQIFQEADKDGDGRLSEQERQNLPAEQLKEIEGTFTDPQKGEVVIDPSKCQTANNCHVYGVGSKQAPETPTTETSSNPRKDLYDPQQTLRHENHPAVTPEFKQKVIEVAKDLEMDPNDLMSIMHFETGGTFDPAIKNGAGSKAVGLIQFMPSTAKGMGTSTRDLASMNAVEQMDYVKQYLSPYKGQLSTPESSYFAVFYPKYLSPKYPDSTVFAQKGTKMYQQNIVFDSDKNGVINKSEISSVYRSRIGLK